MNNFKFNRHDINDFRTYHMLNIMFRKYTHDMLTKVNIIYLSAPIKFSHIQDWI